MDEGIEGVRVVLPGVLRAGRVKVAVVQDLVLEGVIRQRLAVLRRGVHVVLDVQLRGLPGDLPADVLRDRVDRGLRGRYIRLRHGFGLRHDGLFILDRLVRLAPCLALAVFIFLVPSAQLVKIQGGFHIPSVAHSVTASHLCL